MRECDKQYKKYLESHISNVEKAYRLLLSNIGEMGLSEQELKLLETNIKNHDKSKFTKEEFIPYSNYFYGDKTEKTLKEFKSAVEIHKKRNPHHLEYWLERGKTMPTIYLIEMVCDWWAFSLQKNEPEEVLDWFNKNKTKINLGEKELYKIDFLLEEIKSLSKDLENF